MNTQLQKHVRTTAIYVAPFICLVALAVVLNMTNPLQTGAASILVVFILLYFLIFSVLAAVLRIVSAIWHMVKPNTVTTLRRGYYILSIISLAPVLFIALNTLGQLALLEVVLIVLLVGLGCFYVIRRTSK